MVPTDRTATIPSTSKTRGDKIIKKKAVKKAITENDKKEIIKKLKKSITKVTETSSPNVNIINNLTEAKTAIKLIAEEFERLQRKTIMTAIKTGEYLQKTKILCEEENEDFMEFIKKDCAINWSKHYVDFFIQLFKFCSKFPKLSKITLSLNFVRNKFKIIREAIVSENDLKFWGTV
jgi:hypothetical protein